MKKLRDVASSSFPGCTGRRPFRTSRAGFSSRFSASALKLPLLLFFLGSYCNAAIIVTGPPDESIPSRHITVPSPKTEAVPAAPQTDLLQFLNKDALHGSLVEIDPKAGVRWLTPEAKAPIDFSAAKTLPCQARAP